VTLTLGTRLGPYEIQSPLGAGGMGEVYRATDTNLGRDVAIKVLPDAFAQDAERIARFEREAKTLASLNHPNIAIIHGLEKSQGTYALVMELVEGEDLSQRISRGPIPLDEALPIAKQIAEALEAAHEQGIIHRDLKPANIKVRPDGTVKVLDFGLAKLAEAVASGARVPDLTMSPTITSPAMMTGVGVLLGTAAYMSPEQAKGRPADKRSDIWGFGCVFYELLTGKRAFEGEDISDTLANILKTEPAWNALPVITPPTIRTLLQGCLEKDRRDRFGDISTPRFLMSERAAGLSGSGFPLTVPPPAVPVWQRLLAIALTAVVAGLAVGGSVWLLTRSVPPRVSRLTISQTGSAALTIDGGASNVAITPDGSRIVYVGNRGSELFVRPLDALEPVSLFKGNPRGPFISPDGEWVGFFDATTILKRVAITGGPAVSIANLDGNSRGATWLPGDTIVFATAAATTGLQQVAADGGAVTVLTRPDRERGNADHLWPELLPDGQAVLFTILPISGRVEEAQIAVLDLKTRIQKVVMRVGSNGHYVTSGHLLYAAGNALRAVGFDPAKVEARGTSVPVVPDVSMTTVPAQGGAAAAVSSDGTLVYLRGVDEFRFSPRTLAWVDRQGRETTLGAPVRIYSHPRLSPDGGRLAMWANDQDSDIWIWGLTPRTLTRLTFTVNIDNFPVWTPDGQRLIFASERDGQRNLFTQAADGTGAAERLTRSPDFQISTDVTPDGSQVIFTESMPGSREDVMQVELSGTHKVIPLVQSAFTETNGIVSPDGRWLAYEANNSGQFEIHVRPYPSVNSGHWQVSTGGGTQPRWSRNGQELFYVSPAGAVMRVGIERGPSWVTTTPSLILPNGSVQNGSPGFGGWTYDISPDGQRFLLTKAANDANAPPPPEIIFVQHFDQELKRLVPTK